MNKLLIRGGRVLIPSMQFDENADILVENGLIADIASSIDPPKAGRKIGVVDAGDLWVAPGLVDIHTHLREPGYEYKETIATGTAAAAAGGFTSIMCMANTKPVNDNAAVTRFIMKKAQETGVVKVFPVGAVTTGMNGETLSEMVDMAKSGCVAFSDDGHTIMNSFILRKALEYLKYEDMPLISHAEDEDLAAAGYCHEGDVACSLGLRAIPSAAEEIIVARDIILSRMTRGRIHFAHLSAKGAIEIIFAAKEEGLPITCEVTPHHLFLTEEAIAGFDTSTKVSPPLREETDREALVSALAEGKIDCVASDHAPHGLVDKDVEYDKAAFGISGLETSLPLCLKLVHDDLLKPLKLIECMSSRPASIMGLPAGDLKKGRAADIVLIDPDLDYTIDPREFLSLGKNTPFAGWKMTGRAVMTIVDGRIVYNHDSVAGRVKGFQS